MKNTYIYTLEMENDCLREQVKNKEKQIISLTKKIKQMENQQEQAAEMPVQEPKVQELVIRVIGDEVETHIKGDVVSLSSALASALTNENAGALVAIVELGLMLSKKVSTDSLKEALKHLEETED